LHVLDATGPAKVLRTGEGRQVNRLAFSPDGLLLASSCNGDQYTQVYEVRTGREVARLAPEPAVVNTMVFLEDGRTLVTGNAQEPLKIWDLARRLSVGQLGSRGEPATGEPRLDRGAVTSDRIVTVDLAPRGRRAALRYVDGTAWVREWSPDALARDACVKAARNLTCAEWHQYFPDRAYQRTCASSPAPRCDKSAAVRKRSAPHKAENMGRP
jgi:WD40 repeat protein